MHACRTSSGVILNDIKSILLSTISPVWAVSPGGLCVEGSIYVCVVVSQHRGGGGRTLSHHTHSHHSALQIGEWNWRGGTRLDLVKTAITYKYYTLQCLYLHHNTQHIHKLTWGFSCVHWPMHIYLPQKHVHLIITNTFNLYMYCINISRWGGGGSI